MTERSTAVCVDASLIAKLLLPEDDSPQARDLWSLWECQQAARHAPVHLLLEVSHAIRKSVRGGGLTCEEGDRAIDDLVQMPLAYTDFGLAAIQDIWDRFVCAFDHLVTPYDAGYLYVADMLGCELWTADDRLVRTVGDDLPWVRSLSEVGDDEPR